ncbi:MAG: diphthamide biosynthesis enzyme Dph2 [Methanothrix sp.]|nr:diphthamide biosynthesis enzyme Dph2 [Methanothrix sp.]
MARAHSTAGSSTDTGTISGSCSCFSGYDLDLDRAVELIKKSNARRVGLQAPEGLKRSMPALARQIEAQTGSEVIISGDPCFGACDVDMSLSHEVDLMLHLGHAELGEGPENVIFLEARMDADLTDVVKKAAQSLRVKRVGLTTTIQHVHKIDQAVQALREEGVEGVLGPAGGRIRHPGQVLGCSYRTARSLDVTEFIFIGTGQFHPLGIALATAKRVVTADPITGEVSEINTDALLRRRFAAIFRAQDAKRFAILASKKPGQRRMALAQRIKALGEARGLEMFLVYLDNVEPDRLLNLGAQAAVSTACPRVALDDAAKYKIPMLTAPEFEIMLGEREWERYEFDEME